MKHLGDTEQSSPTPVVHVDCKYWVRSRTTGAVTLAECRPSLYNSGHGWLNITARLPFERFDVFGPVTDETTQPDFDLLIEETRKSNA